MDRQACRQLDDRDDLSPLRARFALPDGVVYLDGNSLGALQPDVATRVADVARREWGDGLIRSWNDAGWVDLPGRVARRIARIVGADDTEVAVTDSTSVNLFKALSAARALRPDRRVILTDDRNFPTDVYVAGGLAELLGDAEVRVVDGGAVAGALGPDVAVLTLTHVDYRSGEQHDATGLTAAARAAGALVVWDLSHSTGAVDVDVHAWQADFAVGCTYKYLNGGPGSPAYLYAARRHHDVMASPLRGWFGHAAPFEFAATYTPAPGVDRFLDGTPAVLSLAALDTALEVWDDLDVATVTARATSLTELFVKLADERLSGHAVEVASPRDPSRRGAQVSLRHEHGCALMQALIARGVIGDFRPPDLLRFGFAPLYVRHVDVWDAVDALRDLLETGAWDRPQHHARQTVT